MIRMKHCLGFIAALWLVACNKHERIVPLTTMETGKQVRLYDLAVLSDSVWLACGGIRDREGWIFRTENAGVSWTASQVSEPRCVYSLGHAGGNTWWAGGDFLHLWKTDDGGVTWKLHWLGEQVPFHGQDRPGVRCWQWTSSQTGWFAGGENLGEGVIYRTGDGGASWSFSFHQHEFRGIAITEGDSGMVVGHGASMAVSGAPGSAMHTGFTGDFLTDVLATEDAQMMACGYDGGIYRFTDSGRTWTDVMENNDAVGERFNWNDLIDTGDGYIACGNNGKLARWTTTASAPQVYVLEGSPHLYRMALRGDQLLLASDEGRIYALELSQLPY